MRDSGSEERRQGGSDGVNLRKMELSGFKTFARRRCADVFGALLDEGESQIRGILTMVALHLEGSREVQLLLQQWRAE